MADVTDFTQDSVLYFLQSKGGTVKNSDLLFHYKSFLRDHENRTQYREQFKKFVNSVATVKQEEGVNYVVLRKTFRGHLPGDIPSGGQSSKQAGRKPDQAKQRDRNPEKPSSQTSAEISPQRPKPPQRDLITHAPPGELPQTTEGLVLPSAGILNNNNNHVETNFNLEKPLQSSSPHAPECTKQQPRATNTNLPYNTKPALPGGTGSDQNSEKAEVGLPEFTSRDQYSYTCAKLGQPREPLDHQRGNCCPPTHLQPKAAPPKPEEIPKQESGVGGGPQFDQQVIRRHAKHRQSYKTAVSYDGDFEDEEEEDQRTAGGARPVNVPLEQTGRAISDFSPCVSDPPAPLPLTSSTLPLTNLEVRGRNDYLPGCRPEGVPVILIQDTEEERLPMAQATHGPRRSLGLELEQGSRMGQVPGDSKPLRSSLPLGAECYIPSPNRAEYTEPYHNQSHHNQHVHLNPSEQRLDPGLDSGLGSRLDPELGSGLDPVLGSGLDPVLDSGLGSRLDPVLGPGQRPKIGPGAGLSSSHSSLFPSSSEDYSNSNWPRLGSPRGSEWDSSDEALHTSTGELDSEAKVQEMLQRAKETKLLALMHRAERKSTTPWHHSTGHLVDDDPTGTASPWHHSAGDLHDDREEGAESSGGSTSSLVLRQRPSGAKRVSSRLRSRMCRSLGDDLDQHFAEEGRGGGGAAARHNRLHLLSSSLSLRYTLSSSSLSSCSTPPRCQSLSDLAEGEKGSEGKKRLPSSSSTLHDSSRFHQQQDLVPLEPKQHLWLVKGAVGSWSDIYSLFREDPTLLNRRDFISGYTVLHWIAKHGDHRVLNTLWYGVNKAGMKLEVDVKTACGYTPLHLAAIHGHKKMMRLLVNKFKANVELRDTSGKKPWQYVDRPGPTDILHLLGAPPWAVKKGVVEAGSQRLHYSSSSARPITASGTTKVKRSSSIAAFLKHKSLLRLTGHFSDFSV